jgi:hypothetical protein
LPNCGLLRALYLLQKARGGETAWLFAWELDVADSSLQALLGRLPRRLLAPRRGGPVYPQDRLGTRAPRLASPDAHTPLLALVPCEAMIDQAWALFEGLEPPAF